MGWAHGVNANGRDVGYGVEAECDEKGCSARIERGLAYACGGMHDGGEHGCGDYFCGEHLYFAPVGPSLCGSCLDSLMLNGWGGEPKGLLA